ncbi:YfbK domain-containing protein [Tautonia marina]|uniref:YfbK domain-containing protein n=1 Tax=Tautonia marina TaxID=2653855 RepID=UPI0012608968|nr:YfbK domain-containing protein [Tautonia marina]
MTFDPDDPNLTAFALGELDEADRLAVESLLARSPEAARFVDEVRETAAMLSGTLRKEPMPGLSIVQRLDLDAKLGTAPATSSGFPVRRVVFAVAASVVMAMSGFGIGVLVADRGAATEGRSLAFQPPAAPGSIGAAVDESPRETAEPASPSRDDSAFRPPEPASDAFPRAAMMTEADAVAEEEVTNPEERMLAMGAVPPGSPEEGFTRSVPSRSNVSEPRFPGGAVAPSESVTGDAMPGLAKGNDRGEPDGLLGRGGGFGGMGFAARGTDTPETVPLAPQAEPIMSPPPAPKVEADAMRGSADQVEGNQLAAVVGTRGIERRAGSTSSQAVAVQPGNVVEVVNLPEGSPAQRFALEKPIREVVVDPTGSRLLASTVDRSVAVFDLQSGELTNSFQVDRGPVPLARFGRDGELIFSNLGAERDRGEEAVGFLWFQTDLEPFAAVPVDPGRVSIAELGRRIEAEGLPIGPETLTGSLVNSPSYSYDRPEDGEPVGVDVRVVPAPWTEGNHLVRLALIARSTDPNDAEGAPPVVVEEVTAEVEFNWARVARYRPIGFEGRRLTLARIGEEPQVLKAGDASTVLFEVEPIARPGESEGAGLNRAGRYQGAPTAIGQNELLTASVAYRVPGTVDRRSITVHVPDAITPMDEATDDVRLATALGWLGLVVQGVIEGNRDTLRQIEELAESTDEQYLPGVRDELGKLLNQVEQRFAGEEPAVP